MSRKFLLTVLSVGVFSAPVSFAQQQATADRIAEHASFTADELVGWVLARNAGIAEREAAIEVAVHRIEPAGSLDDPALSYSFAPRTFGREGQGLNQKFEFSQAIPWPGTLKARRAAASHRAQAAREDEQALRLELAAAAKAAFSELYFIQRAIAIHHDTHALLGELKSVAEARYAAGNTSQQDVLQAELEIAQLDRHLLALTRNEATIKAQINGLLNRDPVMPLPVAGTIGVPTSVPTMVQLERLALTAHPRLKRLDAQIAAHGSEVKLAKKIFYPDLRFIAGYNSLWDEPDKRPIVGLSVNIPLDRGKRRAELRGAQANARRAELERVNEAAQLLAELTRARAGVIESIDSVALYQTSVLPLATEFLEATLADYRSGSGGFLSVITAEKQKLQVEEGLERSRADITRRLAELELWTGADLTNVEGKTKETQR